MTAADILQMTDEELRVQVALAQGWIKEESVYPSGMPSFRWVREDIRHRWTSNPHKLTRQLPDFAGSLDACASFERGMTDDEAVMYFGNLLVACATEPNSGPSAIRASARARCIAYLITKLT